MSAWGANAKSCKSLLDRVERNDPALKELFILPTKTFGGSEVDRLAENFEQGKNTNLKVLSASGHKVPNDSLFRLGKSLAKAASNFQTTLSSIAIGDNSLGDEGVISFCKGIQEGGGRTCFEHIDLSWKGFGLAAFTEVLKTFNSESCPQLRILNVSRNNKIGEDYEQNENNNDEQLVLLSSLQQLEELDLSECQLPGLFVAQFLDGKRPPANLKKLFLQGNPFGDGGFEALMTLVGNAPLQELNTSKCQLTDEAMRKISFEEGGSLFMPSLRSWNLCDNQLTEIAISHLGEGLKHATVLPQLKELNLSGNELGENGVKLLAAALETRNSNETLLEILDLTNTKCTVEGASAIIQRSKVKTLHLFNNNLSSDGFRTLSGVLKGGHPTMEYLDLGGNGADQASVVVLLNALVENSVVDFKNDLKTLVVGGNESGDAVEQIVCKVKVVHPRLEIARDKKKSNDHR